MKSVETKNPFNPQTFVTDKYSILDVKATDASGDVFVVEFQTTEREEFPNRMLYYCCKSYCLQINEGDPYTVLRWVIGIAVTSYLLHHDLEDVHNSFHFVAKKDPKRVFASEGIQMHTLEVTDKKLNGFEKLKPQLRTWTNFFYYSHLKSEVEMTALLSDNPAVFHAYEKYRQFNNDEHLRAVDEAHQRYLHDYATDTEAAHSKGKIEGKIEGIVETARNLKGIGISLSDIAKATNLPLSAIEDL